MKKETKIILLKAVHFITILAVFVAVYILFYESKLSVVNHMKADLLLLLLYSALLVVFSKMYCAYGIGRYSIADLCFSQSLTQFISLLIIYFMSAFRFMKLVNPLPFIGLLLFQILLDFFWAKVTNYYYYKDYIKKRAAVIYSDKRSIERVNEIKSFSRKYEILKQFQTPVDLTALKNELNTIDCIFIFDVDANTKNELVKYCVEYGIDGYFAPSTGDVIMLGAQHVANVSVPFLLVDASSQKTGYLMAKRFFDILVSMISIIIFSPFMLITGIIIKLYDRGPVFYKQVRLTENAREFKIIKFRSMRVDAEKDGIARLSTEDDDRITPVGKIIRKIRFDELPQLVNILKGDMSLVGPRPERPEIAAQYKKLIPEFALRLQVKAGLTGFAQVYGKYNTDPKDKLQFDLMYINNMGVMEDLRLMFMTLRILFSKESTEGVEVGQTTAMDCGISADSTENDADMVAK